MGLVKTNQKENIRVFNEFLEYAKVFNHYYGTSKSFVIKNLKKGNNVIFDIDWQGTEKIKEKQLKFVKFVNFLVHFTACYSLYKSFYKRPSPPKHGC